MQRSTLLLVFELLLVGCALPQFHWVNYSSPGANYSVDDANCGNEAMRVVPASVAVNMPPPQQPNQQAPTSYSTSCVNSGTVTNCATTANGSGVNWGLLNIQNISGQQAAYQSQQNAEQETNINRSNYKYNCMKARGWSLERQ
jgi:hypothetical protein